MHQNTISIQVPPPVFFNETKTLFDCGILDTCNFYSTKEECERKGDGLPCYEDVATTIVEYITTFTPQSITTCHPEPNILFLFDNRSPLAYTQKCVTTQRMEQDTQKTGKTFEGRRIFATKRRFFSTEDNIYLMPALLVIGSLALVCAMVKKSAKKIPSALKFD